MLIRESSRRRPGCVGLGPDDFEVMFRPYLYRDDDSELIGARAAAVDVMYDSARASLAAGATDDVTDQQVANLVAAGWSLSHGSTTLMLTANLRDQVGDDPAAFTQDLLSGIVALSRLVQRDLNDSHVLDAG